MSTTLNSKRISFASSKHPIEYPDFLDIQLKSFRDFFQLETTSDNRYQEGLFKVFSETGNVPAKLIKEFRKKTDKPVLKGAYIETAVFIGDNQLESLASLKSKNELVGEIIGLLQSPAKNVLGALQSGGGKIAGIVKTLSERPEKN